MQILDRAELGRHTNILKVKSHPAIDGNDWADILANQAADGDAWDVDRSDELVEPYDDMIWIKQSFKDSQGAESSEHFLRNLQDCAKAAVYDKYRLGRDIMNDQHHIQATKQSTIFGLGGQSSKQNIIKQNIA